ncbi:MAG: 2-C-methyl-D-erythritol 4-phosphate cytidylyltransferase [Ignavibacteria bacterium]|nr:2-C-methyl-D-erythritol 4-phosphate cytidylyltransferase [Ignavibacteria bacterium]
MKTFVIIPAAGIGKRFNSTLPKQFLKINGIEILVHTLLRFQKSKLVYEIVVAVNKNFFGKTERLVKKYNLSKVSKIVLGGEERQHSVYSALTSLNPNINDLICVHDAVRPLIKPSEIDELIEFAQKKKSVIAAKRAVDTIKTGDKFVEATLDRNKIWLVQTPQIFSYKILKRAFEKAMEDNFLGTDEASLVERIGVKVYFYQIKSDNRKITLKEDFEFARHFI